MKVGDVSGKETQVQRLKDFNEKVDKGAQDFKSYLSENEFPGQGVKSTTDPAGELEMGMVNPMLALSHVSEGSGASAVSDAVTAAVGEAGQKLDQVVAALGSGKVSLKELGKAVDTLSEQADNLQQTVKELPGDHPLRKLGDELKVLAYTESVKWQRGDYA